MLYKGKNYNSSCIIITIKSLENYLRRKYLPRKLICKLSYHNFFFLILKFVKEKMCIIPNPIVSVTTIITNT